jgi:hypothetical protein
MSGVPQTLDDGCIYMNGGGRRKKHPKWRDFISFLPYFY